MLTSSFSLLNAETPPTIFLRPNPKSHETDPASPPAFLGKVREVTPHIAPAVGSDFTSLIQPPNPIQPFSKDLYPSLGVIG
ncbi:MAG: hypothetical protein WCP19_08010, partial [Chloroflexota bacterium]